MVAKTSGSRSLEALEPFVGEWGLVAAFKDRKETKGGHQCSAPL
jgi:hypothetical protein